MYFDKNRLVVLRDETGKGFVIAYPNKDGKRYLLINSDKVVDAGSVRKFGRFEDAPIVLVKNKNTKHEIKSFRSVKLLSKEDVARLEFLINQKQFEYTNEYKSNELIVMTPKNDKTREMYFCVEHDDNNVYIISKNKIVPKQSMEEIGMLDDMFCNIILTEAKNEYSTVTPKTVMYIHELTERDVLSLESKFNAEKVAFSYNDQSASLDF